MKSLWHSISHSKIYTVIHGACVVSMLLMASGMALAAYGSATGFMPILQNFASHIWTGVSTYLVPGVKGLATASVNLGQSFGLAKGAAVVAADPVSSTAITSAIDPMVQSFNSVAATKASAAAVVPPDTMANAMMHHEHHMH